MTYNVFSGMLNPTQSINQSCHCYYHITTIISIIIVTMTWTWRTGDVEHVLTNHSQVSMNVAYVQTGVALHCKPYNKTPKINSIFTYLKQRNTANATQKCKLVARSEILLCNLLTIQLTIWQYSCNATHLAANYHANALLCLIPISCRLWRIHSFPYVSPFILPSSFSLPTFSIPNCFENVQKLGRVRSVDQRPPIQVGSQVRSLEAVLYVRGRWV